ncbi:MAG: 3-isopropylmalate dehydrogenase, partial [Litorimonas sp.]
MNNDYSVMMLPGDGIGPEVCAEVNRLIQWLNNHTDCIINVKHGDVGGCAIDKHGTSLTDETLADAATCDAILLGAVGGPKWDDVDYNIRPEAGLLKIRKELDLFANLRPALVFAPLADASSLKPELVRGLDMLIVRELTSGVYFGEPRGIETLENGERKGINTHSYTSHEIRRVAEVAFEMAKKRSGRVTSCEKANVMEAGKLWREEVTALHKEKYSDVELSHMYADNAAMQIVRQPKQFDVILTDNLFGDILSDA